MGEFPAYNAILLLGDHISGVDRGAAAARPGYRPPVLKAASPVGVEGGCRADKVACALVFCVGVAVGSEVAGHLPNLLGRMMPDPGCCHASTLAFEHRKDPAVEKKIFVLSVQIHIGSLGAEGSHRGRVIPRVDAFVNFGEAGLGLAEAGKVGQRLVGERSGADVVAGAELSQVNRLTGVRLIEGRLEHGTADDRASHFLQARRAGRVGRGPRSIGMSVDTDLTEGRRGAEVLHL